jgi:integrative and conjugative element protein (TIGR02256 family)
MRLRKVVRRVLRRPEQHTVWISESAATALLFESERTRPNETGGILLGYRYGSETVILKLIGPGPKATHLPAYFHPDSLWQERQLESAFRASGGTVTYVGDWHTHLEGSGRPSGLDKKTAGRIEQHDDAQLPEPLVLINLLEGSRWHPYIYVCQDGKLRRCGHRSFYEGIEGLP